MKNLFSGPQAPLIITLLVTLLLSVGLIGLLSMTGEDPLTQDQINALLVREDSHKYIAPEKANATEQKPEVVIVEFSDFQCPACASVYPDIQQIKTDYKENVVFIYRHFPLRSLHPLAQKAAEASEAAAAQGKFWEMHDVLFEKQIEWSKFDEDGAQALFKEYAQEIGVEDIDRFERELEDGTYTSKVNNDVSDGDELGVSATPTVYLDGTKVAAPTYDEISTLIKEKIGTN